MVGQDLLQLPHPGRLPAVVQVQASEGEGESVRHLDHTGAVPGPVLAAAVAMAERWGRRKGTSRTVVHHPCPTRRRSPVDLDETEPAEDGAVVPEGEAIRGLKESLLNEPGEDFLGAVLGRFLQAQDVRTETLSKHNRDDKRAYVLCSNTTACAPLP